MAKVVYKRKFSVPGDTIKKCWDFRKRCHKKYGYTGGFDRNALPCYHADRYRDESRCPYPINKPTNYIVSEMEDGTWRCSCPVWKFRRQQCHHIGKAQRSPEEYEIAKEHTGTTTEIFRKLFEGA